MGIDFLDKKVSCKFITWINLSPPPLLLFLSNSNFRTQSMRVLPTFRELYWRKRYKRSLESTQKIGAMPECFFLYRWSFFERIFNSRASKAAIIFQKMESAQYPSELVNCSIFNWTTESKISWATILSRTVDHKKVKQAITRSQVTVSSTLKQPWMQKLVP